MKKTILVFSLLFMTAVAYSRQQPISEIKSGSDTIAVALPFSTFNQLNKYRLDSIEHLVPLPYNAYVQEAIEKYSKRKIEMGKMLGLGEHYFPIFEKALAAFDVPIEMKYLPIVESSLDPFAISKSGAIGLWQFMAGTAKGYRLEMNDFEDERKDPTKASFAAAAYLKDAYIEFGDWLLALAAYNCGSTTVNKAIAKAGSRNYWEIRSLLPLQGQNYIPAFIGAVYTMNYADNYQITRKQFDWLATDTILVNKFLPLSTLADAIGTEAATLEFLNPVYRKGMINGSIEQSKKVVIPKVGERFFATLYAVLNLPEDADLQAVKLTVPKINKAKLPAGKTPVATLSGAKPSTKI